MKMNLSLSNLITKASRVVVREYQQEVAPLGITPSQAGIVYILSIVGPLTQVEIANRLHLEKTNINAMVKKLQTAGHVKLGKDSGDARKTIVKLSGQGTALAKKLVKVDNKVGRIYDEMAGSEKETAIIRSFLEKIVFGE